MCPALGEDSAGVVEREKRDVGIGEICFEKSGRGLGVEVILRNGGRRGLRQAKENDRKSGNCRFGYGVQRYVTVCWILSRPRRSTISSEPTPAKVRLRLVRLPEKTSTCSDHPSLSPPTTSVRS